MWTLKFKMVPVVISSSRSCNPEIGRVAPENSRYNIRGVGPEEQTKYGTEP